MRTGGIHSLVGGLIAEGGDKAAVDSEAAAQEGVADAYVCRLLPLTCLAPDLVAAILDGRQPKGLKLAKLLRGIPLTWETAPCRRGGSATPWRRSAP